MLSAHTQRPVRGLAAGLLLLAFTAGNAAEPTILPALREPVGEIGGTLVIAGGGALPDLIRDRFVQLAGGAKAKLVIISDREAPLEFWRQREVASVQLLQARERDQAGREEFVKPLTEATAVWMDGVEPHTLTALYRGTAIEKELHKLLARGGVIGGTAAGAAILGPVFCAGDKADAVEGFKLLPGAFVEPHFQQRERLARLTGLVARHTGYFGLGIDEQTAVVLRGRHMSVFGNGSVVVYQAAGPGRPANSRKLTTGQQLDLVALSRDALVRAGEPFPPLKPQPPNVAKGTLVIGGGGGLSLDIWKRFIELAGGPDALILVVPTANPDPLPPEPGELKALVKAGARNVKLLHTRNRAEANQPEFVAPVKQAGGVWFGGGRQWRFVDSYEGTATEKAFHEVLTRDGAIGGSSAGASIQSEYMPRGDPLGNLNIIAPGYERGFGFLKGVAIDQHFFARKREPDMTELMKAYPQLLGVGIDEGTVLIVKGSIMEVAGKSKVAVYDRTQPVKEGARDYEELPAGTKYDLAKRRRQ